ncbi:MAG TPA: FtsX-like permease family protein [Kofleriaceae bacterium]|nr:FtsX-like permease family protein [Kofleriaceae bacterium]
MREARWAKLVGDLRAARGRVILMIIAITASLAAVGAVLGAYGVAGRELDRNYTETHPASATLELDGDVTAELAAAARARPGVTDAEPRGTVLARVRVGADRMRFLLFVVDDFRALRLNTFTREAGAWPPPDGTILIERSAAPLLGATIGDRLTLEMPHGRAHEIAIAGLVHDPGLAPAWQERTGYGYVTRATLASLGEPPIADELRIAVAATDRETITRTARDVAAWLMTTGHPVREIRVPPSGAHPHAGQMRGLMMMMAIFAVTGLLLGAILVAATLAALLARQTREIGVLKAIGARTSQVARMYVAIAVVIAVSSTVIAVPLGLVGARALATMIAGLLNFELASTRVPAWVLAVQIGAGLLVPVIAAKIPVLRAARITVRKALDDDGALTAGKDSRDRTTRRSARFALAVRNAFRRPARLALVLGLLAAGGAMFLTAKNVELGWHRMVGSVYTTRHYDVELRTVDDQPAAQIANALAKLPGVRTVEAWGWSPAAFAQPGAIDVVRTYPDGGHGSFTIYGVPRDSRMVDYPLLAGRWLGAGDADAVVLNHNARAQHGGAAVGDAVTISIEGRQRTFRVVGIVQEVGAAAAAYVDASAFARPDRARLFRVATNASDPDARIAIIRAIDDQLARDGIAVAQGLPLAELKTAMGEHVVILVRMLQAMALLFALVGVFGLASAMSANVIERGRELGVLRAIGAPPRTVLGLVVGEGVVIGALSWLVALALAIPLALVVGRVVGALSFGIPLPLSPSVGATVAWLAIVLAGAAIASGVPAWRASRRPVHDALARP